MVQLQKGFYPNLPVSQTEMCAHNGWQ